MAHEQFRQTGFDKRLSHLIEECGEVIAAAGKLQRFGPESVNPLIPEEDRITNLEWLRSEMADLQLAIHHMETEIKC